MRKYNVEVCITDHFNVEVEAENEEEARERACEIMAEQEKPLETEFFSHSDGFDSCGCFERTNEKD